eukprot:8473397-Pyramimonas_sp.AAC.1
MVWGIWASGGSHVLEGCSSFLGSAVVGTPPSPQNSELARAGKTAVEAQLVQSTAKSDPWR